jgi:hypothetical protein
MRKIIFLSCALILFGCKKMEYDNEIDFSDLSCELCDFAEQIEGHYLGVSNAYASTADDSVTFDVQQIFLNESTFIDSTLMYFTVTQKIYRSNGDILIGASYLPENDTIIVSSTEGWVVNKVGGSDCDSNGPPGSANPTMKFRFKDEQLELYYAHFSLCVEYSLMDVFADKQ